MWHFWCRSLLCALFTLELFDSRCIKRRYQRSITNGVCRCMAVRTVHTTSTLPSWDTFSLWIFQQLCYYLCSVFLLNDLAITIIHDLIILLIRFPHFCELGERVWTTLALNHTAFPWPHRFETNRGLMQKCHQIGQKCDCEKCKVVIMFRILIFSYKNTWFATGGLCSLCFGWTNPLNVSFTSYVQHKKPC